MKDMRKGGLDRVLLRLASRVGGSEQRVAWRLPPRESRSWIFPNPDSEADHPLVAKGKRNEAWVVRLIRGCVINTNYSC
jgi:hypothetical protein